MKHTLSLFILLLILFIGSADAASLPQKSILQEKNKQQGTLQLADVFGEGMVLQQKQKNNFWGKACPLATVQVEIQNKRCSTKVGRDGLWKTSMKGLKPGGPFVLKVTAREELITLSQVYVGEVWLASGQSNMERSLSLSEHGQQVVAMANNENIHFLMIPKISYGAEPIANEMRWQTATTPQVGNMSAIAYYFAKNIQEALHVPVGIICAYKGGVPAEAWVSEEVLRSNSKLIPILERYQQTAINNDKLYEQKMEEYKTRFKRYNDSVAMGFRQQSRPLEPIGPKHHKRPSGLYHTMLQRIMPYSIKGVIWYQGEGNAERGEQYKTLFPALIEEWRKKFEQPKLPFYFVQLSNFDHPFWQESPHWAELREAQLYTWQTVKNSAMIVSIDKGEKNDVHPIYKQSVGERLAMCALNLLYKMQRPYSGPIYRKAHTRNNKIEISFDFIYSGLDSKGESLSGFSICGGNHQFVAAKAAIVGNRVIVWADEVKTPIAVRYGWTNWSKGNLFNKNGLPASPFRTDNFPMLSDGIYYPVKIR